MRLQHKIAGLESKLATNIDCLRLLPLSASSHAHPIDFLRTLALLCAFPQRCGFKRLIADSQLRETIQQLPTPL